MAGELQGFEGARLIATDWADGDSFQVQLADGARHSIRLYGADTLELHVSDKTDARRLSAQRRYSGINYYGDATPESIKLAKSLGAEAKTAVQGLLAAPFTVHTNFADSGGDGRYKRSYGFITTADGRDLATELVARGLAQRAEQRREDSVLSVAMGTSPPTERLDVNTAARDELMRIPSIGEHFANAISETTLSHDRNFKNLLFQLEQEFGKIPDALRQRVQQADPDTLLRWSGRVLTEDSIDAVVR